jgi:hypothetical protein
MPGIDSDLAWLFGRFESIAKEHSEFFDTDVRESIALFMNCFIVWGKPLFDFPHDFGLYSPQGNDQVASVLREFVERVVASGVLAKVPVGQPRLDLLQPAGIKTPAGRSYDEFYGYRRTPLSPDERLMGMPIGPG